MLYKFFDLISSTYTSTLLTDTLDVAKIQMPLNGISSTRANNSPWLKHLNILHHGRRDWKQTTSMQIKKKFLAPLRGGADEVPFISVTAMLTGLSLISRFLFHEKRMYNNYQRSTDKGELVSWEDYIQYRIDFYFSVTSWTKPLLLMSTAFVLIFISTCVRIVFLRESFGTAAWSAWTFVADAGPYSRRGSPPPTKHII